MTKEIEVQERIASAEQCIERGEKLCGVEKFEEAREKFQTAVELLEEAERIDRKHDIMDTGKLPAYRPLQKRIQRFQRTAREKEREIEEWRSRQAIIGGAERGRGGRGGAGPREKSESNGEDVGERKVSDLSSGGIVRALQRIDEYEFERLVAGLWEEEGWKTRVTTGSNDKGVDVVALQELPYRQKHLIQAKRFADDTKVSGPEVQLYSSLRHQEENVDAVVIVTTSSFTSPAKSRARELNVKLVDGKRLGEWICRGELYDVVEQYL